MKILTPLCLSFFGLLVVPTLAGDGAIVIDDADAGFTDHTEYLGGAPVQSSSFAAFNGSAHHSLIAQQVPPVVHVSWLFSGLDPSVTYDVAVGWSGPPIQIFPPGNLDGEASYTITGGSEETAMLVHNVDPVENYVQEDEGGNSYGFQTIASLKPKSDGTILLELRDEDGLSLHAVIADAALVCPASGQPTEPLVLTVDGFDTVQNEIRLILSGMVPGESYRILKSESLDSEFVPAGVTVTDATPQPIAVGADEEASPKQFYKAEQVE